MSKEESERDGGNALSLSLYLFVLRVLGLTFFQFFIDFFFRSCQKKNALSEKKKHVLMNWKWSSFSASLINSVNMTNGVVATNLLPNHNAQFTFEFSPCSFLLLFF